MTFTYQQTAPGLGQQTSTVVKRSDGAFIPFDPANIDFLEYQKWLDEGNTPEAADVTEVTNEVIF